MEPQITQIHADVLCRERTARLPYQLRRVWPVTRTHPASHRHLV